jgi:CRISPR-associated protein Csm3
MKKTHHYIMTATIKCLSGLRIGGSDDLLQIGGTDLTCIKHPVTLQPYLPGSSLKGKLRSELEKRDGKFGGRDNNQPCGCMRKDCLICRIFGPHMRPNHDLGPSRIIVRDAPANGAAQIETKTENIIDRKTGTALHPRQVERVAAGAMFDFELSLQVLDDDDKCEHGGEKGGNALVAFIEEGLALVELSGIGSGVSKGYGRIKFTDLVKQHIKIDDLKGLSFEDAESAS